MPTPANTHAGSPTPGAVGNRRGHDDEDLTNTYRYPTPYYTYLR